MKFLLDYLASGFLNMFELEQQCNDKTSNQSKQRHQKTNFSQSPEFHAKPNIGGRSSRLVLGDYRLLHCCVCTRHPLLRPLTTTFCCKKQNNFFREKKPLCQKFSFVVLGNSSHYCIPENPSLSRSSRTQVV